MSFRSNSIVATSLFVMTCLTLPGCANFSRNGNPCGIEKPGIDVIEEQLDEAIRAEDAEPVLPATYEYMKRLDRDCGIFDE